MNKEQEKILLDFYSTNDNYVFNERHSDSNKSVFTSENDKYKWLIIEQKGKNGIEVRMTDENGKITTRDNYEVIGNNIKCISVEKPNGRRRVSLKEKLEEYKAKVNCQSTYGEKHQEQTKQNDKGL